MTVASRKLRKNLGGTHAETVEPYFGAPTITEARTNVIMLERVLLSVIRTEVDRLKDDKDELDRFFGHFFDPVAGATERAAFVASFQKNPPVTVLGYPRTTAEFPCFSVILESEEEEQNAIGDYLGETVETEDARQAADFLGAVFSHTFGIYVYAQHPDVCAYLYQFVKLVLFGAKPALIKSGMIEPHFSGGELSPEEMYLPDNMFARVFRITTNAVMTAPALLVPDPGRVRLTGVFMNDVVVDGVRGGVTPYEAEDTSDE